MAADNSNKSSDDTIRNADQITEGRRQYYTIYLIDTINVCNIILYTYRHIAILNLNKNKSNKAIPCTDDPINSCCKCVGKNFMIHLLKVISIQKC